MGTVDCGKSAYVTLGNTTEDLNFQTDWFHFLMISYRQCFNIAWEGFF